MLTEEQKRDYPELIGKCLTWKNGSLTRRVKLIGCNYHIGITLVRAKDHKKFVHCLRGPLAPQNAKNPEWEFPYEYYDSKFSLLIEGINKGEVILPPEDPWFCAHNPNASLCPFGQ